MQEDSFEKYSPAANDDLSPTLFRSQAILPNLPVRHQNQVGPGGKPGRAVEKSYRKAASYLRKMDINHFKSMH
jgi:hypothetical protein